MALRALIFDVDGTLAETEELHRVAFNAAFREAGIDRVWDEEQYRVLLQTTGGRHRILRDFADNGAPVGADVEALAAALHAGKNRHYALAVASGVLKLRSGVSRLIREARNDGLRVAIATTTGRANLVALLAAVATELPAQAFDVVVTGDDVVHLKPDPEVYHQALLQLHCTPDETLAFEDSRNGLDAARAAGIPTIVTPSLYTGDQTFPGATAILEDLTEFALNDYSRKPGRKPW